MSLASTRRPDRELQAASEAMVAAAQSGQAVLPVLRSVCPHVYRQIAQERKNTELLALWGRSDTVDENVGRQIVHQAILEAIGELAGVRMRGRFVHAGLQHTYGYLFSLIETPYGRKRERWVSTDLEKAFGLDPSLLSDRPKEGTLLANLTCFLGHIVYRGRPRRRLLFERSAAAIAPALLEYDYDRLAVCRVVEEPSANRNGGPQVLLITDLVTFPKRRTDESTLLVYSIARGSDAASKLITTFPVTSETVRQIRDSVRPNEKVEIRLRYNAYVRGLHGRTVIGRRCLAEPAT